MKEEALSEIDYYIGKKLRDQRIKRDLTLSQVASFLGVSLQQVQKYEQGKSRLPAVFLYKMAQILDVPPIYFYEGIPHNHTWEIETEGKISTHAIDLLTICLIEDDSSDELIMREIFESAEPTIKVISFHDGEIAFDFFKNQGMQNFSEKPDLIFLDLNIPKKNGLSILKDLKRNQATRDIPVIVVTNSINSADLLQCYQNFASGYIFKSFDYPVFEAKIHQVIDYWTKVVLMPKHCQGESSD